MIKRIYIDGYKSFKCCTIDLRPLSIIFGPNASGKSNLIDIIPLISALVHSKTVQDAFKNHRGNVFESFYYSDGGYEALLEKDSVAFTLEVDVELSDKTIDRVMSIIRNKRKGLDEGRKLLVRFERRLRYRIEIEGHPKTGILRVKSETLCAVQKNGNVKKSRNAFIETKDNKILTRMEGQGGPPIHYDLGLDHTVASTALYEPHYPHITAFKIETEGWRSYYLEPTMMRRAVAVEEAKYLSSNGDNLSAFLNVIRFNDERVFDNLVRTLKSVLPQRPQLGIEPPKGGFVAIKIFEDNVAYSSRIISEGTLRVLGLISALMPSNQSTVVAFEEPENGVHPVRLRQLADIVKNVASMKSSQVILTTHSPLFPDYFENKDLFVCRKTGRSSEILPFQSQGPLLKRLEIEEALMDRILRGDYGG